MVDYGRIVKVLDSIVRDQHMDMEVIRIIYNNLSANIFLRSVESLRTTKRVESRI